MGKLDGKAVLITGASRGIGLAIARTLDSEGAKLILVGRNHGPLARAAALLPGTVLSMPADVTKPGDVKRLIAAVQKQVRRLDVLINNAGVFTYKPFAKTTWEDWRRNIETNLTSIFLTTQAALPLLKRSQGDVVNILSISSRVAFPNCSAYAAAKFGALGLTGVLRRELRAEGIRVMAVLPGMTKTRMKDELDFPVRAEDLLQPEDVADAVLSALAQPRRATVEEILLMPAGGTLGGEN
ncbi:MAG: SDR family NAD(P)-dependent oxidoreductase [Terriglobia bacterium]|jgi:NAD(P)-dependent dehydrogenase (short-subunit alcohol dehydrogenase family)